MGESVPSIEQPSEGVLEPLFPVAVVVGHCERGCNLCSRREVARVKCTATRIT